MKNTHGTEIVPIFYYGGMLVPLRRVLEEGEVRVRSRMAVTIAATPKKRKE